MKWIGSFLTILFLFSAFEGMGQKIQFTDSFEEQSIPERSLDKWGIDPVQGGYIFLIYQQPTNIQGPKMYLFVDKLFNDKFLEFESTKIYVTKEKNWISMRYIFKKPGTYKIAFLDAEKNELASRVLHISYKTHVFFSTKVDENYSPNDMGVVFNLQQVKNNPLYIFIKKEDPFKSDFLSIKIFKHDGKGYGIPISSDRYDINPDSSFIFVRQTFSSTGDYKVFVYNQENELIDSGFLKIQ